MKLIFAGTILPKAQTGPYSALAVLRANEGAGWLLLAPEITRTWSANLQNFGLTVTTVDAYGSDNLHPLQLDSLTSTLAPEAVEILLTTPDQPAKLQLSSDGFPSGKAAAMAVYQGDTPYLVAAPAYGAGISTFAINADNAPIKNSFFPDTSTSYLYGISDMTVVRGAGNTFIVASSAYESGISVLGLAPDGTLRQISSVGPDERLPANTITSIEQLRIDGTTFIVAGASGSSSLSVLKMGDDGSLTLVDHVIDTQATRFASVTALTSTVIDGQAFVAATGSDQGITLFRMTAEGHLVHADTLASDSTLSLAGLNTLDILPYDQGVVLLTAQANGPDITLLNAETTYGKTASTPSGALHGTERDDVLSLSTASGQLYGWDGNDILSDGPGNDTLIGGDGADIFLMRGDGMHDQINDIRPGTDLIDLSLWPLFHQLDQLDIQQTGDGAILNYHKEQLILKSWNEQPLNAEAIATLITFQLDRGDLDIDAVIGTLTAPPTSGGGESGTVTPLKEDAGHDFDPAAVLPLLHLQATKGRPMQFGPTTPETQSGPQLDLSETALGSDLLNSWEFIYL